MSKTLGRQARQMIKGKQKYGNRFVLGGSESAVSGAPAEIVCYGLGSCVGVFLYDKIMKIGAAAHIMYPGNDEKHESNKMLQSILNEMVGKGCNLLVIRAKIVGGANIMNMKSYQIGRRNVEFVKKELKKKRVLILVEDTGGVNSRNARLNVSTGEFYVNNVKQVVSYRINNKK